jgi:hypothetical protein
MSYTDYTQNSANREHLLHEAAIHKTFQALASTEELHALSVV